MSNLSVFNFQGQEVRFVGTANKPEWVAQDVCNILGIDRTQIRRLDNYQKGVCTVQTSGGPQKMITLTTDGLKVLISTSRSPKAQDIARQLGIDVYVSPVEADCLRILVASFKDLNPVRQFNTHGYKIDLYLPPVNIAVECDEFGHKDRELKADFEREKIIKSALGCSFIRFNPNKPGFNIGDVVNAIRDLI